MKLTQELTKLYYTIGEVSELFGVSASLLRYWESEFSILKPQKNRKGDRRYIKKDIHQIERIYTLVKERGFTLEGAKKELKRKPQAKPTSNKQILNKLLEIRKNLKNLHDSL